MSSGLLRRTSQWWFAQRYRWISGLLALAVAAGTTAWLTRDDAQSYDFRTQYITGAQGPTDAEPVQLDTTLYLPENLSGRAPAVLLAHGFGGDKRSVAETAQLLVKRGYVVLAYSARGFGRSTGTIHLNDPDYEVADARRLLDWLSAQPEVLLDDVGDPRVGAVGASYGGALALMLAGTDARVDAVVPQITWNDLNDALFPGATTDDNDGVFKRGWAGLFFGFGTDRDGANPAENPQCGRFAPDICELYLTAAITGRTTPEISARLLRSSPASVLDRINAPTLLIQGTQDSLFGLDQADANARGIAATGTPVRVAWFDGGHDGGEGPHADVTRTRGLAAQWLSRYVKRDDAEEPSTSFTYSQVTGLDAAKREPRLTTYRADDYPGLTGDDSQTVAITGEPSRIANPPNGTPAARSSVPLAGAFSSLLGSAGVSLAQEVPGQHAQFDSARLTDSIDVVGAPRVSIRVAAPDGEAVVFVKLYDVAPDGETTLPASLIAPVRLHGLSTDIATAEPVSVQLPGIVHRFQAGHRMRVVVATSDDAYTGPVQPAIYDVASADAPLIVPTVAAEPVTTGQTAMRWVLAGAFAAVLVGVVAVVLIARTRRRRTDRAAQPPSGVTFQGAADTPLVVRNLRKVYSDGFVAVHDVSFTVAAGQVMGLLGPNGAGKTTSLRVLLGLTTPSGGEVRIFGHRLRPGAPVLSRLGALVEGPGFLPHLSGVDNLRAYWRATGRPAAEAQLPEVLAIAGLGAAVERKVRTYSHGMKQRLAVAQAMLGMPRLLLLDEPTDGLDPPQIAEMRRVLQHYAEVDGRAVLVSSHLLAEVEQTCTHVVVLHAGRSVANGTVAEIVGDRQRLEDAFLAIVQDGPERTPA